MPTQPSQEDPLASLPQEVRAQLREAYLDEAGPMVDDLETALLTLEGAPDDEAVLAAAFRAAHTIKGSAAGVGFRDIAAYTHEVEDVLDSLRGHRCRLEPAGLSALLGCVDMLRAFLAAARHEAAPPAGADSLALLAATFTPTATSVSVRQNGHHPMTSADVQAMVAPVASLNRSLARLSAAQRQHLQEELRAGAAAYRVRFILPEDAFLRGLDPVVLLGALGDEATLYAPDPLLGRLPSLEVLDPEACYLGFQVLAVTAHPAANLHAVFEFCAGDAVVEIATIDQTLLLSGGSHGALAVQESMTGGERQRLGEILLEEGLVTASDLERALGKQRRLGEILVEEKVVSPENVQRALAKQQAQAAPAGGEERGCGDEGRAIRVKQTRLDGLINLVGELVTARNALLHLQGFVEAEYTDPRLTRRLQETTASVSKAVGQLQTDVLSLRMVPVQTVFQRLPRVVRDVAVRADKQVSLQFSGEATELDKCVADALFDPLVHLVRNAVGHGIEGPAARRAAGKSEVGHLDIGAWREGNDVVVEVRDDGAGIDRARVVAAAVEKGMIDAKRALQVSDAEALDLMFASGLSTARELSDISGRGVGLDAVRSSLSRIGGSVHVTTVSGQGTAMRLRLPLTLSVFRALVVRVGEGVFALPLDAVRATAAIDPANCKSVQGRPVVSMRGSLFGLVSLASVLGLSEATSGTGGTPALPNRACTAPGAPLDDWHLVVVDADGQWVGLLVDALDPPQEIMVKPVDAYLTAGGTIAGASVLGDGRVALVLEPAAIAAAALAYAQRQERRAGVTVVGGE